MRSIGSSAELLKHLLGVGYTSVSGKTVTESSAMNVAAFWTGVNIRSRLLAALPVHVIEKQPDGRSARRRPDHYAARVLLQPNGWQTGYELRAMLETHRVARGNAYAYKETERNIRAGRDEVTKLFPMHPDRVEVIDEPDEFGPTTYKLHRRNGKEPLTLSSVEVLHLKGMSTDGRRGRSVLQDLREVLGGALATQEHANSLWSHDATPSIALRHPGSLSPLAKTNLEKSWEETYGRGKDKKRVAVIEEGMEIEQLSLSPEDGQFLQTAQDLRQQLAAALMVPPHMMGLAEKATSWGTGIEQQQIGLLTFALSPDVVNWEERLHEGLIHEDDPCRIKFNINGFMRGDSASRSMFYDRMVRMGAFTLNDVLAYEDMNPFDGGDEHITDLNRAPIQDIPPPKGGV